MLVMQDNVFVCCSRLEVRMHAGRNPLWRVVQCREGYTIHNPSGFQEALCITFDDVMAWINMWEADNDRDMSFEFHPDMAYSV